LRFEYFRDDDFKATGITLAAVMKVRILATRGFNSIIISLSDYEGNYVSFE